VRVEERFAFFHSLLVDNVTHAFAGALIAEAIARALPAREDPRSARTRRNALVWILVVGSNLPDLDFVYTAVTGGKIGYLLHHRGHTHTVIGALIASLVMLAALAAWTRRRGVRLDRGDRIALAISSLLGPLLHIAMDFTNDYGVHPFWPLDDRWFYGDSIFIVEPLLWAASAPLVFLLETRIARVLVAIVLAAGVLLAWLTGFLLPASATAATLLTLAMLAVGYRMRNRAALIGVAVWSLVTLCFALGSARAKSRLDVLVRDALPAAVTHDRVLSAIPSNPLCWAVLLVQTEGEQYVVRRASLSTLPELLPASRCPRGPQGTTAPLARVALADSDALAWRGEFVHPRKEFVDLFRRNCEASALARFTRAPYTTRVDAKLVAGDLRYDREASLGFAEVELAEPPSACPEHVPPWIPPRNDVLR
jgi:inner membrane protein